ncbi:MAG: hypothetical protein JWN72_1129 [Thermoleophilia bacterium]|nr:hypothetical protein [Thermoleophilia bacterium]
MSSPDRIDVPCLRRFVVARQGFATQRSATADDVAGLVHRLQAVQLDSISAVERAHRLTIGSRIGRYGANVENELLGAGRIFEYWAHEACLVAIEDYPLMRRRMVEREERGTWSAGIARDWGLEVEVLARIRDEGPLPVRAFDGGGGGGMWNWKPAK